MKRTFAIAASVICLFLCLCACQTLPAEISVKPSINPSVSVPSNVFGQSGRGTIKNTGLKQLDGNVWFLNQTTLVAVSSSNLSLYDLTDLSDIALASNLQINENGNSKIVLQSENIICLLHSEQAQPNNSAETFSSFSLIQFNGSVHTTLLTGFGGAQVLDAVVSPNFNSAAFLCLDGAKYKIYYAQINENFELSNISEKFSAYEKLTLTGIFDINVYFYKTNGDFVELTQISGDIKQTTNLNCSNVVCVKSPGGFCALLGQYGQNQKSGKISVLNFQSGHLTEASKDYAKLGETAQAAINLSGTLAYVYTDAGGEIIDIRDGGVSVSYIEGELKNVNYAVYCNCFFGKTSSSVYYNVTLSNENGGTLTVDKF